jgi:hypothetical protein
MERQHLDLAAAAAAVPPSDEGGSSSSFERKVRRAKRAARSELSVSKGEWSKHGYASRPDLLQTSHLVDTLPRVNASCMTAEQFAAQWETPRRPCILTGLCDAWPAQQAWTPAALLSHLGDCKFKVRAAVLSKG